ncbi:hypothetical protein GHT09_017915 [Marmota monax]|uniref:HECT-type E3 ubiquitin transferase n=1 Tax=Marmota monax TaxID=9995 RepID=A0A834Q1Z8_MARMO|nr:hypothetical protein GHT09_017915 [Marmota monax]
MFSFEGDFKTRPKVSLGGASRKEEKSSLLHRTQEERRKREEERRRLKNAVIIQSFIRGYRDRKQQYSLQRTSVFLQTKRRCKMIDMAVSELN